MGLVFVKVYRILKWQLHRLPASCAIIGLQIVMYALIRLTVLLAPVDTLLKRCHLELIHVVLVNCLAFNAWELLPIAPIVIQAEH
jgi:hypothetical protein